MANLLKEELRREMRCLEKAKQKLQSAVAVYVDPILRDASVVLHMPMTDTGQLQENIAALRQYRDMCYEVEDVLRHKCGDGSSISLDSAFQSRRKVSRCISGLVVENESDESICHDDSPNKNVIDEIDFLTTSSRDTDSSDTDTSSLVTVVESTISTSAHGQSQAHDKSVRDAIAVLENLDARLRSHFSSDSGLPHDQSSDENVQSKKSIVTSLQAGKCFDTSLQTDWHVDTSLQADHREEWGSGQMMLQAKFKFATSLPIGLDDLFRSPDDALSPLTRFDGEWTFIHNQGKWTLDDDLNCFFPRDPGYYAVGIYWQQSGAGILKVSVGTRDSRLGTVNQFPIPRDKTQSDGEIGRKLYKCFLSAKVGIWVSICRLSFNPKLSDFTLTCQRFRASEMKEELPGDN